MKRKIVSIDETKCNGCGICAEACHEGAIEIINGKAKLISDEYCDGFGDCLPTCPTNAIIITEREAADYDEDKVKERMEKLSRKNNSGNQGFTCPGSAARLLKREDNTAYKVSNGEINNDVKEINKSELRQWPVQIKLVGTKAPYFSDADILIAADCTAYAYANFHKDFIKGRITMIGCPKLDDVNFYKEKIAEILKCNNIRSIKVVRMSVPCCGGIVNAVKSAMLQANIIVPYSEVIINPNGDIVENV